MTDLYDKLFKFEEYYHYLESSFVDITGIIPLENDPDTFSPRLYEILQSACSQVDGIIQLMHEEYIPVRKKCTAARYEALNQGGVISCQMLVYKSRPDWKYIRPFSCDFECASRNERDDPHGDGPHDKMPKWWDAYNDSKHELPEGYKAGSIRNAYLALAGLYVLQVMMQQRPHAKNDFLKLDAWKPRNSAVIDRGRKHFHEHTITEPLSKIFISSMLPHPKRCLNR